MTSRNRIENFRAFRVFHFGRRLVNFKECVLLEEVGNFRVFHVFAFGPDTEIKISESSEIFSRLVNFKECVLFKGVGNFQGFRIFDFGPYTEMENPESSEILFLVNLFYLRKFRKLLKSASSLCSSLSLLEL